MRVSFNMIKYPSKVCIQQKISKSQLSALRTFSTAFEWDDKLTEKIKHEIEHKWKKKLKTVGFDVNDSVREKSYILSMFPYPSGNLHMGHVRVYTISDTIARFHRLNGRNVFHPIGFDAFGLPAENAAKERNISAEKWTWSNIKTMREQLKQLELSFDWDNEIVTCSPDYYKFTQYLFLLMYEASLVYQKEALVNWDPVDKTVLADEQVDSTGRSWRSGAIAEKKCLKQWFIQTTRFAESLRRGLETRNNDDWKDVVKLQKNWIGECNGTNLCLPLQENENNIPSINIWTKFPEFIKHASFIAAASDSILSLQTGKREGKLNLTAKNPFTNDILPIYITDKIEFDDGCDIKLCFPCFGESDKSFAVENQIGFDHVKYEKNFEEQRRICKLAINAGIGGYPTSSKLRDWLISRQRRWGTPIPIVHCTSCGTVPVPFDKLPVMMPELGKEEEWLNTECPKCAQSSVREKDTMDTFVDSCWYFLRFADSKNSEQPFIRRTLEKIMPVDIYIGGKEHAILHLYYARFMSFFLHSIGYLKEPEPFKRLLVQGMVMGRTYKLKESGKYVTKSYVDFSEKELKHKETGLHIIEEWEKMSKSKHNGVEPSEVLQKYGIDTTRLFILSDVSPTSHKYWSDDSFPGILKWQQRVWTLVKDFCDAKLNVDITSDRDQIIEHEKKLWDARNYYVKTVSFNYNTSHQLSVAISKLQGFTNSLKRFPNNLMGSSIEFEKSLGCFLIMLFPMTPHFASELWSCFHQASQRDHSHQFFNWDESVSCQKWPVLDSNYNLELTFKVNNAVKGSILLPYEEFKTLTLEKALKMSHHDKKVKTFLEGCDLVDVHFKVNENFDAVLNVIIDHHQKNKIKSLKNVKKQAKTL